MKDKRMKRSDGYPTPAKLTSYLVAAGAGGMSVAHVKVSRDGSILISQQAASETPLTAADDFIRWEHKL